MITLKNFKTIALLEGISYLLLLGIGSPLKHFTGNDIVVRLLGMPHGLLFVTYILMAFLLKEKQNWNLSAFGIILVCSIIPFGTFYVDKKYLT
ncbi:MAG: DUF3817 domain-containing protein [Wenyingzhuangia sp.]|jgi:integral membrane protein|uniref:DUF3817 domain-containing protein n=1 Tax=Wenyingzhuangia sp. TaxID=1964193 RepID=UPI00321C29FC